MSQSPGTQWQVVVSDDAINMMNYVVYVLRTLFGYDGVQATELMLEVHEQGRAVVVSGPREKAEMDCHRLQRFGLVATVEKP